MLLHCSFSMGGYRGVHKLNGAIIMLVRQWPKIAETHCLASLNGICVLLLLLLFQVKGTDIIERATKKPLFDALSEIWVDAEIRLFFGHHKHIS